MEQQYTLRELNTLALGLLLKNDMSFSKTKMELIANGLEAELAEIIISNIEAEHKTIKNENAYNDMLCGLMWFGGGLLFSFTGMELIYFGAITFGIVQFLKGFIKLL